MPDNGVDDDDLGTGRVDRSVSQARRLLAALQARSAITTTHLCSFSPFVTLITL